MSFLILRISNDSQKLKLANDFYSYCFSLLACDLLLHMQPLRFFDMSKSIYHNYFKPVGNCNGEQQVKLPIPTSPLMKEIPFLVISVANNGIESSMKESLLL